MKKLEEAKATGEDSYAADAVTPAGGSDKKRPADNKTPGEKADNIEKDVKTPEGENDEGLHEAVASLFEGTDLSDSFKLKVTAIYESALHSAVSKERETIREEFEEKLNEQVETAVSDIIEKVDEYLDHVVESWMQANKVEIDSNLKVSVAESLIKSFKGLVENHNMDVSDKTEDKILALEGKISDQSKKFNDLFEQFTAERKAREAAEREVAFRNISEGMTDVSAAKLRTLSEGFAFTNTKEYAVKLEAIKTAYFTEAVKTPGQEVLEESVDTPKAEAKEVDSSVKRYAEALTRFAK